MSSGRASMLTDVRKRLSKGQNTKAFSPNASKPCSGFVETGNAISPTSVLVAPDLRHSVIAVNEDGGAEVTLDPLSLSSEKLTTPDKPAAELRGLALLDSEITPSSMLRSPSDLSWRSPSDLSFRTAHSLDTASPLAAPMCGWDDNCEAVPLTAVQIQSKLCVFLESPVQVDAWSQGWQVWSYFTLQQQPQPPNCPPNMFKETIRRSLYHRTRDIKKQKARLAELRRDLSPFNTSTPTKSPHALRRAHSLQAPSHVGPHLDDTPEKLLLWNCGGMQCLRREETSPDLARNSRPTSVLDDDCYDSDPEDFCRHKKVNNHDDSNKENANPSFFCNDDEDVRIIVRELMNERLTLILHNDDGDSSKPSQGICAWIERGQTINDKVVPPQFAWKTIHKKSLSQRISFQRQEVCSVPLLDIHRVVPVSTMNRTAFPFAKTSHCFMIKTLDQTLVLEASSVEERNRLVQALKFTVARLGSMVLVKDAQLIDEFFVGQYTMGPGDEPNWLNDRP